MISYMSLISLFLAASKTAGSLLPAGDHVLHSSNQILMSSVVPADGTTFSPVSKPGSHSSDNLSLTAAQGCGNPILLTPLYELWHPQRADSFYTANVQEKQTAIGSSGYTDNGIAGYLWLSDKPQPGTVPLYRLWNDQAFNHFYTSVNSSRNNAVRLFGYKDEGIAGHVYPDGACGGIPLYALTSNVVANNFYTTSASTRDNVVKNNKDKYEYDGVAGWLVPY